MKRLQLRTSSAVLVYNEHRPQDRNERSEQRRPKQEGLFMAALKAANAIPRPELKVHHVLGEKTTRESSAPVTREQRFEKLLRERFEGHEEFLGATPD